MPRCTLRRATLCLSLLALGPGAIAAGGPPVLVKAALETGRVTAESPALVKDVLVGEVPGIRASLSSSSSSASTTTTSSSTPTVGRRP